MKSVFAIVILAGTCLAQSLPSLTVYAGTPVLTGFSGDSGQATNATLANPLKMAVDSKGNLYIADQCNNRIRKVDFTGVITTVAGSGNSGGICGMASGYSGDGGPATAAQLSGPSGVAVDSVGNVYIADSGNQVIRKVDTTGKISTFAGGGTANPGSGGPATGVGFTSMLAGLAIDGFDNLYIADGISRVFKVTQGGTITTVAGAVALGYSGDGGSATQALLSNPSDVAVDVSGNLYIADTSNCVIRKVSAGLITTVAGTNVSCGFYFDSSGVGGSASSAHLNLPWGVAVDAIGDLYIGVPGANNVREVLASSGMIQTVLAANENYLDNGKQSISPIRRPEAYGVAVSGTSVYVADHFYDVVWTFNGAGSVMNGAPTVTNVLNNSSLIPTLTPSSLFHVFGTNMATPGTAPVLQDSTKGLPLTLNGTSISVMVNGTKVQPAIYYSSSTDVAGVLPASTPTGNGTLTITYNNQSATANILVVPTAFGFDIYNGAALATDAVSGALITNINSAQPGETLLFWGTGVGADPNHSDTTAGGNDSINIPVTFTVGGVPAKVVFTGALFYPGVQGFGVTIPPGAPTGCSIQVIAVTGSAANQATSSTPTIPIMPGGGTCSDFR